MKTRAIKSSLTYLLGLVLTCVSACAADVGFEAPESSDEVDPIIEMQASAVVGRDDETPADRRATCMAECVDGCGDDSTCLGSCATQCSRRAAPYYCKMTDNSYNHWSCEVGMFAWVQVCHAECGLMPGIIAGLCVKGCDHVYENKNCVDASICQ